METAHLFAILTLLAAGGLVACDLLGSRPGRMLLKPLAATGFIATAWAAGAGASPYGRWLLLGLAFSWIGDVALLARATPWLFQLGLGSFLLGHLAYGAAFLTRGVAPGFALGALVVLALPAAAALRWLAPNVSGSMQTPVRAYIGVITIMVVLAAATVAQAGNPWILVGAGLFYVSDLAVARERFVTPSRWNGAWGTPTYFGGQVVLALTAG